MLQESLGLIETIGLTAAVAAADAAVKSANVTLVGYELANGDGMTVVKVRGDVGAVKAAVSAAAAEAGRVGTVVSTSVIARPANGLGKIVESGATVGLEPPAAAVAAAEVSLAVEDVVADDLSPEPVTPVTEAAEAPVEEVASVEPEVPAVAEASVEPDIEVAAEPAPQAASHAQSRADRRHRRR
ncbi:BMC domain-containing protein [Rhizobium cellulosilyticum]|jgi:microcompartment protein CcmL/EutN|uniref:Microcompartment protein CcmL/EutN n=1 Tax=Aliirhizobium cellulosilyticum TaxID=393664 RepID=A0A7W6TJG9_9HYPH|nr:BMC domain-containing protein [Rhizobium cellulosilyticum]MBB4351299.1 microcompartment protein CcmL/EutN [Rhizobium cellulosilyticum]MBB4414409.1 microcompartment protein CcmL/EutN [Rhizobium cellulosilyticum]MBB4449025.1 microcompartment protein CcmL/EutN [Rhizobium cellulosilyticum]